MEIKKRINDWHIEERHKEVKEKFQTSAMPRLLHDMWVSCLYPTLIIEQKLLKIASGVVVFSHKSVVPLVK